MSYIGGVVKCPNCGSEDTRPAESDGRICRDCGTWF